MHTILIDKLSWLRIISLLVLIMLCGSVRPFPVLAQSPDLTSCCECLRNPDQAEEMIQEACQTVHGSNSSQVEACADTLRQQYVDACLPGPSDIPTLQVIAYFITVTVDWGENVGGGILVELDDGTDTTTATTNAEGVAQFSALAPGDYTVRLPDWESVDAKTVTLTKAEPTADVRFDSRPTINAQLIQPVVHQGTITVIVTGSEREREGALVEIDDGTKTTTATINAEGMAEFSALPPGDYTVRLPDWESVDARTVTLTEASPAAEVQFDLWSTIRVTVNAGQSAREGVLVEVEAGGGRIIDATTNAQGIAEFPGAPLGDYTVRLPEWRAVEPKTVTLAKMGSTAEVQFDVGTLIRVSVQYGEDAEEGVLVEVEDDGGRTGDAVTNAQGIVEFAGVPFGDYTVRLPDWEDSVAAKTVTLTEADSTAEVEFNLLQFILYTPNYQNYSTVIYTPNYQNYSTTMLYTQPEPKEQQYIVMDLRGSEEKARDVLEAMEDLLTKTKITFGSMVSLNNMVDILTAGILRQDISVTLDRANNALDSGGFGEAENSLQDVCDKFNDFIEILERIGGVSTTPSLKNNVGKLQDLIDEN